MFTIGGVTGVLLGNSELDNIMHDSYFVTAHFHYVLSLGATIGLLAALVQCVQLVFGLALDDKLLRISVGLLLLGTNTLFWPMHITGMLGYPRRIAAAPDQYSSLGASSYAGCFLVFLAVLGILLAILLGGLAACNVRRDGNSWFDSTCQPAKPNHLGLGVASDTCLRDYTVSHTFSTDLATGSALVGCF
jgi:cytochrome c oxidase subunit 1